MEAKEKRVTATMMIYQMIAKIILITTMFRMIQRRNAHYRRQKKKQRLQRRTLRIGKFFMRLK